MPAKLVFETRDFRIIVPERPHVSRPDGGHLVVEPKIPVEDRTHLSGAQTVELARLTAVAGEAMTTVLLRKGIAIGRINYQDNGNWRHELHVHLYGRARGAVLQPFGHALAFPPTAAEFRERMGNLEPLNDTDAAGIREEIVRLLGTAKYREI